MAKFIPPSGREHPPLSADKKVGGVHSAGQVDTGKKAPPPKSKK